MFLTALKTVVLDLLFPAFCLRCGRESEHFCQDCRAALPRVLPSCIVCGKLSPRRGLIPAGRTCISCQRDSSIYAFFSPFRYETPEVRELIHALKYRRVRPLADILGALLAQALKTQGVKLPEEAFIIPLPLHSSRARVRGFNQSSLIARFLGRELEVPVREDLFWKIRPTRPQTELSGAERRTNLAGSFAVREGGSESLKNRAVVLVDDVKTTGATLEEAARVLKEAGAKQIWAITVAH